jgi:hypothetical protein
LCSGGTSGGLFLSIFIALAVLRCLNHEATARL